MSRYPIYAQKKITLDSEEISCYGVDSDAFTFNDARVVTGGTVAGVTSIASIYGVTSAGATAVVINSAGKLGTVVSTRKRKRDIEDLPKDDVERLYQLKPKRFRMIDDPSNEIQYGLIAEEVDEVMKECTLYDKEGLPATVQYQKFYAHLIAVAQAHKKELDSLRSEVEKLKKE